MPIRRSPLRLMMLDDHAVVRQGMTTRLAQEADIKLLGSYGDSHLLQAALRQQPVDILLLDFALQPSDNDGFNLIRALHARHPETDILVMSAHYNTATVALALRGGARGFVGKQQDLDEVVQAIRVVAEGKIYLTAEMAAEMAEVQQADCVPASSHRHDPEQISRLVSLTALSPREQEVIRCFMSGMTVTEIAHKFSRSIKTISRQKQDAMQKLGLKADHELFLIREQLE